MSAPTLLLTVLVASADSEAAGIQVPANEVFVAAMALDEQGRATEALALLGGLAARYPQDPGFVIQCAWLAYEDRDFEAAAAWYERVLALSPGHYEARLGLAWCRWQLGETAVARAEFETLAAERPGDDRALHGLRASAFERRGVSASASGFATLYPGNPGRQHGEGLTVGVSGWAGSLLAGATYRGTRFVVSEGQPEPGGPGSLGGQASSYAQHEAWAWTGLARTRWGVSLHGAYLADFGPDATSAVIAGVVGRLQPLRWTQGILLGEASVSVYDDLDVYRLGASWEQPLGASGLYALPLTGLQFVDGEVLFSQGLELGHGNERRTLRVGARLGRELRPAYLGLSLASNLPETVTGGAWVGLDLPLGERWTASLSASASRLEAEETTELPSDDFWAIGTQAGLVHSF